MAIKKETCNTNDIWIGCELEQSFRKTLLPTGFLGAIAGTSFLISANTEKQRADEALVKILERNKKLGLRNEEASK